MKTYDRLLFRLDAAREDAFAALLWSAGTLGFEVRPAGPGQIEIDAFFPPQRVAAAMLAEWRKHGVELRAREAMADRDWLADYRAQAEPLEIGNRFWIDPGDVDDPTPRPPAEVDGRFALRIPARVAFGTGSHASTQLAIELLETLDLEGRTVLDVGTGSGILSFAALLLGAQRAVGFDLDAPSVCVARQNAVLNQVHPVFYAGRLAALRETPRFDVVLVNVLPERIRDELALLASLLAPAGRLINSGNLYEQQAAVCGAWATHGLQPVDSRRRDEWAAWTLRAEERP